jgi:hypothetical protein
MPADRASRLDVADSPDSTGRRPLGNWTPGSQHGDGGAAMADEQRSALLPLRRSDLGKRRGQGSVRRLAASAARFRLAGGGPAPASAALLATCRLSRRHTTNTRGLRGGWTVADG